MSIDIARLTQRLKENRYCIISRYKLSDMTHMINVALSTSDVGTWECLGAPFFENGHWNQAMVKKS